MRDLGLNKETLQLLGTKLKEKPESKSGTSTYPHITRGTQYLRLSTSHRTTNLQRCAINLPRMVKGI